MSTAGLLETGWTYDGVVPVRVCVRQRAHRIEFSDGGGAVTAAGANMHRVVLPDHIELGEYSVNVSRKGVVFLPGSTSQSDEWLAKLPDLVAEGSLALYEALLDAGG